MALRDLDSAERATQAAKLVEELHGIVAELEGLYPGRKFTLDGHLVGSIGETIAAAMFEIDLLRSSTPGRDAWATGGGTVEIKATYGRGGVGLRDTSRTEAKSLIVLRLSREPGAEHEVVYNGPLRLVYAGAPLTSKSNGQASIRLSKLRQLNREVADGERIPARGRSHFD
jgi:hypothetical protein